MTRGSFAAAFGLLMADQAERWFRYRFALMAAALAVFCSVPAFGQDSQADSLEEIVVYGRAEQQIGSADAASAGLIGFDDIQLPPLLRVGELVEAVPGMVATQHSGTGKANQYFLRGFNLDHGTDFAVHAEGVPINMRTHGHGQGYLDLNFLIPELVETTTYRKGPYSARVGDFSSAGSVAFAFFERVPESMLGVTVGEDGYYRGLAAGSLSAGGGVLTAALDATTYDGPWDLDENLEQYKAHVSYAFDLGGGRARLTFQGYDSEWDSTDQIPERAVRSGLIDELGYIDDDLGGQTERYALIGALDFGAWSARAYAVSYDFTLYSNFTYFLEDPGEGDEFEQRDERTIYGGSVNGELDRSVVGLPAILRWGGEARYDDIDEVGLYDTVSRVRSDLVRQDSVEQLSIGGFGEAELAVTERLRAILGLRADWYDWDVDATRPGNGGSGDEHLVSPKATFAYRFSESFEGYANWGKGFHSNDVRGATIAEDPRTGDPVEPVDVLVESEGAEVGVRYERGTAFNASVVGFWLELDSELVFVGDAGTTEPNDGTERRGVEVNGFWQATPWLALNASYTYTDAEFQDDQAGGREIPGAVESTFTLGANAAFRNGVTGSLRLRYLGEAPLVEDDTVRADDSLLVNAGIGYRRGQLEARIDVFNLLDSDDYDISYFYASRLNGEPAEGVEDIHFHPLEPRTVRASVTLFL